MLKEQISLITLASTASTSLRCFPFSISPGFFALLWDLSGSLMTSLQALANPSEGSQPDHVDANPRASLVLEASSPSSGRHQGSSVLWWSRLVAPLKGIWSWEGPGWKANGGLWASRYSEGQRRLRLLPLILTSQIRYETAARIGMVSPSARILSFTRSLKTGGS